MTIHCDIDEGARCVRMAIDGDTTAAQSTRFIAELVARRSELAGWDWIQDWRKASDVADNRDIERVAEIFAGAPPGPCWTVFVSHDLNLALWCKVMDAMFRDRLHRTATTPEAAAALLVSLRAPSPALSSV